MPLSNELISEFVEVTMDKPVKNTESTIYGTVIIRDSKEYVQFDGSDLLTPITSVSSIKDGDRVLVRIKNNEAVVTGNLDDRSASSDTLNTTVDNVGNINSNISIISSDIVAVNSSIGVIDSKIQSQGDTIDSYGNTIEAINNNIIFEENDVKIKGTSIKSLDSSISTINSNISTLDSKIVTEDAVVGLINTNLQGVNSNISSINSNIENINSNINTIDSKVNITNSAFDITDGKLTGLSEIVVNNLVTNNLNSKYANIDFANITEASISRLFADTGMINDLVVNEGHVTGTLNSITVNADLINAGTLNAERINMKGEDGLYYQLNLASLQDQELVDEIDIETIQNGLHGAIINNKTIDVDKINVTDLEAFKATIGGFHIDKASIYSGAKAGIDSNNLGIYLGSDGQLYIGDANNHIKYYKSGDQWKLDISAAELKFGQSGTTVESAISDLNTQITQQGNSLSQQIQNIELTPGPEGPQGIQGVPGKDGKDGKDGTSVTVKGSYDTMADLLADNPPRNLGDAYVVGLDLVLWNGTEWKNVGQFKGQDGAPGEPGATGAAGQGVTSIVEQYYLSTSNSTQTGGSWSNTCPAWASGKYIWTRTQVNWINPTKTTYTTPVLADGINSANSVANTANTTANTANQTANTANTTANNANTTANTANQTANTANTNATNALNTANSANDKIDNLQIGGRNLIRGTSDLQVANFVRTNSNGALTTFDKNVITLAPSASSSAIAKTKINYLDYDEYKEGTYVVSYEARYLTREETLSVPSARVYLGFSPASRISNSFNSTYDKFVYKTSTKLTTEWTKHYHTFVVPTDLTSGVATALASGSNLCVEFYAAVNVYTVQIRNIKLEQGTKPTAWTPAPEDTDVSIENVLNSIDAAIVEVGDVYATKAELIASASEAVIQQIVAGTVNTTYLNDLGYATRQDVTNYQTSMTESIDGLSIDVQRINNTVTNNQSIISGIEANFDFSTEGLIIGKKVNGQNSKFRTRIDDDSFDILNGSTQVGTFASDGLDTPNATIQQTFKIGNIQITADGDTWIIQ